MMGTRVFTKSRWAWLSLSLTAAGCSPSLDKLRQEEEQERVDPNPNAGSSGSGGAAEDAAAAGAAGSAAGDAAAAGAAGSAAGDAATAGAAGSAASDAATAGAAGSAASGGAIGACVPRGAEICNAVDDDCSGVVDDGCPSGVTTVFDRDLPPIGDSPGGSVFADDCKDGEVLGGIHASMGGWLEQVRGVCRRVKLELNPAAPSGYTVRLVQGTQLSAHPETTHEPLTALDCPENEALAGLRISQQSLSKTTVIPSLWITCAKLTLYRAGASFAIQWEGGKRGLPPAVGHYANTTAWFHDLPAPEGVVPTRLLGSSGAWVDRIGLGVSKLHVAVTQ